MKLKAMTLWVAQVLLGGCLCTTPAQAQLPVLEVIKAGVTKAIKALDLKVQRLQNETIKLQNAQKVLENELSKVKLQEITDWTEKQRLQYEQYYRELAEVRTAISFSLRLKEIVQRQATIMREYRSTWQVLQQDNRFSMAEKRHMETVYAQMLQSLHRCLGNILLVATSGKTQMGDAERLEIIAQAEEELESVYRNLRRFNSQNISIALQRAKSQQEIEATLSLFGLTLPPHQP